MIEQHGYRNIELRRIGLFDFTFKAQKDSSVCEGVVTSYPGNRSISSNCVSTKSSTPEE